MYRELARIFQETLGIQMPYYGESGGVLYTRFLKALLTPKRERLPEPLLRSLLEKQGHKCAECDDKVTDRSYDVHHKKRLSLCAGEKGANSLDNLAVLCKSCHSRHTVPLRFGLGGSPGYF